MTDKELEEIYKLTKGNRDILDDEENEDIRKVGCIYCRNIFTIAEGREMDEDRAYTVNGDTVLCPFCEHETLIFEDSGVKVAPGLLNELKQYYKKNTNPSIELTFDEITGTQPAICSPCVWLALMGDRRGCAVDCDFYSTEEAPAKFREFLNDAGFSLTRTVYQAVDYNFEGIYGDDAVDAIIMALIRYFETEDCIAENTFYGAPFDVDFTLKFIGDSEYRHFTLHPDGTISTPSEKA